MKTKQILVLSSLFAIFLGCTLNEIEIRDTDDGQTGRMLTASAIADEDVGTKGYWHYMEGGVLPFHWTGTERLSASIFPKSGEDWYILKNTSKSIALSVEPNDGNPEHATLKGTNLSTADIQTDDFICFTNGKVAEDNPSEVEFVLPDNFIQVGTNEDGLSDYMYIYGQSAIQSADEKNVVAGDVVFRHLPSTFRIDITNRAGEEVFVKAVKISVTDAAGARKEIFPKSKIMTVDPKGETAFSFSDGEGCEKYSEIILGLKSDDTPYLAIPDNTSVRASLLVMPASFDGEKITVSILHSGQSVFTDLRTVEPKTLEMQSGHIYVLSAEISTPAEEPETAVDLSADGTANTYIINKAATRYCFNATVKGNGVARTYSWTDSGTEKSAAYGESELRIAPESAELIWYNNPLNYTAGVKGGVPHTSPVVIESVEYSDGRIYFETPVTFVEGNAMIAACDASGEVLWSWNIWAVENYVPEMNYVNVNGYMFMDRNLGAIRGPEVMDESDERKAAWAIGHYYQWGRKDPFPAAGERNNRNLDSEMEWGLPTFTPVTELQQDYSAEWWGSSDMMFGKNRIDNVYPLAAKSGAGFSIDDAVAASVSHPYRWVTNTTGDSNSGAHNGGYLWMMNESLPEESWTDWHYLWGGPSLGDNEKSIYDPCPAGWKVAPPKALNLALSTSDKYRKSHGILFGSLYVPFAGQRKSGFGGTPIIGLDSEDIFLQSSGFSSGDRVHPLRGQNGGITTWNTYAGAGYQIRCVREDSKMSSGAAPRAVLMGDSITETWAARSDNKKFFPDNNYIPKGISGQTSANIKGRLEFDAIINSPLCVVICCGINDFAGNDNNGVPRTVDEVFNNIKYMAETAYAAGSRIVIGSTPPTARIGWLSEEWNAENKVSDMVMELNGRLKAYVKERGFVYADYHSALKDENNDLKEEYRFDKNDHVHPGARGFAVMEPILVKAVNKAINPDEGNTGGDIGDIGKVEW